MARTRVMMAVLAVVPVLAFEIYELSAGDLIAFTRTSPYILLYIAIFEAVYAAWSLLGLEYFPRLVTGSRGTQICLIISLNLGSAALILAWLVPLFVLPLIILIFAIADLVTFLVVRDCLNNSQGTV